MSSRFIRSVVYRTYLDDNAPLTGYELYENGNHRYAFLTFYNNTTVALTSFDVRVILFDKDKEKIGEFVFHVANDHFNPHTTYSPEKPLPLPLECEGFNYRIENVEGLNVHLNNLSLSNHVQIETKDVEVSKPLHCKKISLFRSWIVPLLAVVPLLGVILPPTIHTAILNAPAAGSDSQSSYDSSFNEYGSGFNGNTIQYDELVFDMNSGYIVGYSGGNKERLVIPGQIDGTQVRGIESGVFIGNQFSEVYFDLTTNFSEFNISVGAFKDCAFYRMVLTAQSPVIVSSYAFNGISNLSFVQMCFFDGCFLDHNAFYSYSNCQYDLYGSGEYYSDSISGMNSVNIYGSFYNIDGTTKAVDLWNVTKEEDE